MTAYLVIAKDGNSETKGPSEHTHTHAFVKICDYRVGVCLCAIPASAGSSHF